VKSLTGSEASDGESGTTENGGQNQGGGSNNNDDNLGDGD